MLIIGHRGARAEAPENTLSGFRYLRSLGVLCVELDIQVARDQTLMVVHDQQLARTTGIDTTVNQLNAKDLAALDACHTLFPDWPLSEGIPTLMQVMQELSDFEHIQFEVKAQSAADIATVVTQLPPLLEKFGLLDRALSTSFNPFYLQALQQAAPWVQRGLLLESWFQGDAIALAQSLNCRSIGPHRLLCQETFVNTAHAAGLLVSTWTVNEPAEMRLLQQLGIHSLITDVPVTALNALNQPPYGASPEIPVP